MHFRIMNPLQVADVRQFLFVRKNPHCLTSIFLLKCNRLKTFYNASELEIIPMFSREYLPVLPNEPFKSAHAGTVKAFERLSKIRDRETTQANDRIRVSNVCR